jgi:hypothetical protein
MRVIALYTIQRMTPMPAGLFIFLTEWLGADDLGGLG